MKKIYIAVVAVLVVLIGVYTITKINTREINGPEESNRATFTSQELGFEFQYPIGKDGYVLEERGIGDDVPNILKILTLMQTEDAANLENIPVGSEGPPTITVYILRNPEKKSPLAWAEENTLYSNINLKVGDVTDSLIAGGKAIRYTADGLYASDNAIAAHGEYVYVFTGMYLERGSKIHSDFSSLLKTVRFIP
jgi:hypothetical protein